MEEINENVVDAKEENIKRVEVNNSKNKKSKTRMILVVVFILIFALISYIRLRAEYLEYVELGTKYLNVYFTNLIYQYSIMVINFIILFFIIYFTNRGIKKGLKTFFEREKKEMPKLPNKSIALVISAIVSVVISSIATQKIMLVASNSSFGITDSILNIDISYYVFQKPVLEMILLYGVILIFSLSIYMSLYYIIIFNRYFDGIDRKMLKDSSFMKKLFRNIMIGIVGISILIVLNSQNMVFGNLLTINGDIDITGAGITESILKFWGYILFGFVIVLFSWRALKNFKNGNTHNVLKNLAVIPSYLVVLFLIMVMFDLIFVNSNELDKEKTYIAENIKNTKDAYNLNIEERNIENSGTITESEILENNQIINNIPIISKEAVLKTLQDNQTSIGHYTYKNINIANYEIDDSNKLVYVAPREIANGGRTYTNKTFEYTHGFGEIIVSNSNASETGNIQYIQKDVTGKDEKIKISEPRIYYGLETNQIVVTNTKNKKEYDYTNEIGEEETYKYKGKAGLKLGFFDRLILGISKGNLDLAFSGEITNESKVLINRNIIERAKKLLPYLIYDENPYTVVDSNGKIIWVLDAYTVSRKYPYSQYTNIKYDDKHESINYIRNSVKVLIDSYDGTISFYITDRTDPIAMAYRNIYDGLFVDIDEQIPEDISQHFVYPSFLYNVQSEILKIYHNVKPDVLYRADDLWDIAKSNTTKSTKSTGSYINPYFSMVKDDENYELGLIQVYTPEGKQNIISYMVGTTDGAKNNLVLYKFSEDSNILGSMQLEKQIEEDEIISAELETLNTTGTKITKNMLIIPINNTLLYVEPIYQTMLNESEIPLLKKVIVASGNKVTIGNNLNEALEKLLSQYAVDIEVENTEDLDGLIDAIIKANKNLTESSNNNDWEMMGKDIKKVQELINSIEKVKKDDKSS